MSQVFSADSVSVGGGGTVPTSGETVVLTGHFLNPPFQNAKAMVFGSVVLTPGTGTTSMSVLIRRNPTAENLAVAGNGGVAVVPNQNTVLSVQGSDAIPDGRPVQYAITVAPTGATAVANVGGASVSVFLISG